MVEFYYLNPDKSYSPCDAVKWNSQLKTKDRKIDLDVLNGFLISTVWIGLGHKLFKTTVFDSPDALESIYSASYSTWDEAKAGHQKVIAKVKAGEIYIPEFSGASQG
jgi:hypothetical protein